MYCKYPITKFDNDVYRYYLREEQSYEGSTISIVCGKEVEVGNIPEQNDTTRRCTGVFATSTER